MGQQSSVCTFLCVYRRSLFCLVLCLAALLVAAAHAGAHPADEASVYHYLWLEPKPGRVSLQHATIVGGLLAPSVWPQLDPGGDGELSPSEQDRHARELAKGLSLKVDGRTVAWKLEDYQYPSKTEFFGRDFPAIKLRLTAALPKVPANGLILSIGDQTYPQFTAVFPQPEVRPTRLTAGPPLISEEGRLTEVHVQLAGADRATAGRREGETRSDGVLPGLTLGSEGSSSGSRGTAGNESAPRPALPDLRDAPLFPDRGKIVFAAPKREHGETGALKGFLGKPLTPALIVLGLGAAFLAGMAHALTPGHGKAMVGAYLVGTRGTVWDAVLLGIVVTVTHTAGVYLLGFLCLWLTTRIQAEAA
jgi:nickel/cobalt transporter (NicO) family protein